MSEFINTADAIGDDELCDRIIMRTVTEYQENRISKIGQRAFYNCTALTVVDVPNVTTIGISALGECTALEALILRSDTIVTMENTNALEKTGIATGTGFVYVPSALVDGYQAATNWSVYAAQIRALESYTVDGTTTGELDAAKI